MHAAGERPILSSGLLAAARTVARLYVAGFTDA
jgi:hypothetical protein